MKNNKGFTIIEMLVVIAIILALSVAAGLSADFSLKNAKKREYKDTFYELFKAVDIYTELSTYECPNYSTSCSVLISDLIAKGLIDQKITEEYNPLYSSKKLFLGTDTFIVTKSDGLKSIKFNVNCVNITFEGLEEFDEWEKCS